MCVPHVCVCVCVSQGCVLVEKGDLEGARQLFEEAAGIEPYCVEALYNLGLVNMRIGDVPVSMLVCVCVCVCVWHCITWDWST